MNERIGLAEIRLVVCDIEGCLTINKKQPIDTGTLTKIHAYCELARHGEKPPIVLCTGRPQPYAEAIIQSLDAFFPNFPSIVENGCFLYDPVEDAVIANPAIEGREKELRQVRIFLEENIVAKRLAKIEPGKELCISLNPFFGQTVENLFHFTLKLLPQEIKNLVFVTFSSSAVDITPKGVNKASGLEFLSRRTGIAFAEMIGIGDTSGDFPMLELVGHPACPANARQEVIDLVKKRSGYVAKASNTSGVWDILLHHNLMKSGGRK
jgi:hypothetical protein